MADAKTIDQLTTASTINPTDLIVILNPSNPDAQKVTVYSLLSSFTPTTTSTTSTTSTSTSTTTTTTTTTTIPPLNSVGYVVAGVSNNSYNQSNFLKLTDSSSPGGTLSLGFLDQSGTAKGSINFNRSNPTNIPYTVFPQYYVDGLNGGASAGVYFTNTGNTSQIQLSANPTSSYPMILPPAQATSTGRGFLACTNTGTGQLGFVYPALQYNYYTLASNFTVSTTSDQPLSNWTNVVEGITGVSLTGGTLLNNSGGTVTLKIEYGFYWSDLNSSGARVAYFVNPVSSERFASTWVAATTDYSSNCSCQIVTLAQGASIQPRVWQNSGSNKTVTTAIVGQKTFFQVTRIA